MTQSPKRLLCASGLLFTCLAWISTAAAVDLPIPVATLQRTEPVDFHTEIMPLLKRSCLACHNEKLAEGGLNLEAHENILAGGDTGPAVVASDLDASLLMKRVTGEEEPLMPPEDNAAGAKPLTPEELGLLSLWIQQGAVEGEQKPTSEPVQWQPIAPALRPIYAVDVSPDGHFVASSRANQVVIHDARTHEEVGSLVDPNLPAAAGENAADVDLVQSLAFSPDGERIATGGYRSVKLWTKEHAPVALDNAPWTAARGPLAANADGSRMASVSAIGDIEIWSTEQNEKVAVLSGHSERICGLAFSQSDERLVSGDQGGRVILWNASSGEKIAEAAAGRPLVRLVASADTRIIAALDIAGQVAAFKVNDGESVTVEPLELEAVKPVQDARALLWIAGDAPRLAVATEAGAVMLIDPANGQAAATIQVGSPVDLIAANPAGDRLVSGSRDGQVKVWNAQSGELVRALQGDPRPQRRAQHMQNDARRQLARVERMKAHNEELKKRLTGEDEAIAKATEQRDKGAEAVAEQTKKLEEPTAALAATEAMIAATKQRVEELEKKLAEQTAAAEAAKAAVAKMAEAKPEEAKPEEAKPEEDAAGDAPAAEAKPDDAAKPEEVAQAEGEAKDDEAKAAEAAQAEAAKLAEAAKAAEAAKLAEAAAAAEAAVAETNTRLEAARAEATKAAAGLEEKQKAVAAAKEAKEKSDAELAKLQSALDALGEARQRLTKAIAEHEARTASETQRSSLLETQHQQYQRDALQLPAATAIAFGPEGKALATAHRDGTIRVYFADEDVARVVLEDPSGRYAAVGDRQLRFSGAETLLALGQAAPAAAWSLKPTWKLQRTIGSPDDSPISDRVTAIDFHPDGSLIAVGSGPASRSGQLQIFAAGDGRLVRDLPDVHSDTVLSVRFSPDGRMLASAAADKIIRLIDVSDGRVIRSLEGHTHHVLAVAWHDNAVTLASASADQSIKVWDTESGEQKRTIGGIPKEATAIRFVKETSEVLSAGADGNVRLHNTDNGAAVRAFNAGGDFLFSLAVSPDGARVLSGGQSGVLRSWVVADGKLAGEMK